jgi:transcriptional antiterminator NusG
LHSFIVRRHTYDPTPATDNVRKRWYAVHVMTGQEEKVKQLLERRAKALGLEEKIGRIVIPKERDIQSHRGGPIERRIFPGYILVEMVLDEETWHLVRRTPGRYRFCRCPGR